MEVKTTVPTTLVPLTEPPFKRRPGLLPERSAQLVVTPVSPASATEVDELPESDGRGEGGFGSTGG